MSRKEKYKAMGYFGDGLLLPRFSLSLVVIILGPKLRFHLDVFTIARG